MRRCYIGAQKPDKKLGYVRIPVEEVARNRTMKDEWPLLEADKGDIVLACASSAPLSLPDESSADAERARKREHPPHLEDIYSFLYTTS